MTTATRPRVFISYSWTSDAYQREVVQLATRLVGDGVDVVIDVWDLQAGHDKYAFMERCVTDDSIDKVLILCDEAYARKANDRRGGVGDETTVITSEVYGRTRQEKFIPVVMERGASGEAFLPAYLGSRMYIDLSDEAHERCYEDLLRCIYGVPKWAKPEPGAPPAWLYGTGAGQAAKTHRDGDAPEGELAGKAVAATMAAGKHSEQAGGDGAGATSAEGRTIGTPDEACGIVTKCDEERGGKAGAAKGASLPSAKHLSKYSWAELKDIAARIAAATSDFEGIAIAKWYGLVDVHGRLQGKVKRIMLTTGIETGVRIIGFRHDKLADGTGRKAGITFEFADVPEEREMNSARTNAGGWAGSEMRDYLNSDFLYQLPEELRYRLVRVSKRTNNRGYVDADDTSVVSETDDVLWLLSMSEVYGRLSSQTENVPEHPAVYDAEGTQYQLYADHCVSTSNFAFCKKHGADSMWWLRSPGAYSSAGFRDVGLGGAWYGDSAYYSRGVSPAFCL